MVTSPPAELHRLLRGTSRSFYLSLRLLPAASSAALGLAYLLARSSDTIADTARCAPQRRLVHLNALARALERASATGRASGQEAGCELLVREIAPAVSDPEERRLLVRLPALLEAYAALAPAQRAPIGACLREIIAGQCFDLEYFAAAPPDAPRALEHERQLERYCHQVAGCVGRLWTVLHAPLLSSPSRADAEQLAVLGERYGKGLQRINIARDLPRDLRRGRCYLPASWLAPCRLTARELLDPSVAAAFEPAYRRLLAQAAEGLRAGAVYLERLPAHAARLRLATALPLLIGVRTVELLYHARGEVLDPARLYKVPRRTVRRLVAAAALRAPSRPALRALLRRELRRLAPLGSPPAPGSPPSGSPQ